MPTTWCKQTFCSPSDHHHSIDTISEPSATQSYNTSPSLKPWTGPIAFVGIYILWTSCGLPFILTRHISATFCCTSGPTVQLKHIGVVGGTVVPLHQCRVGGGRSPSDVSVAVSPKTAGNGKGCLFCYVSMKIQSRRPYAHTTQCFTFAVCLQRASYRNQI